MQSKLRDQGLPLCLNVDWFTCVLEKPETALLRIRLDAQAFAAGGRASEHLLDNVERLSDLCKIHTIAPPCICLIKQSDAFTYAFFQRHGNSPKAKQNNMNAKHSRATMRAPLSVCQ